MNHPLEQAEAADGDLVEPTARRMLAPRADGIVVDAMIADAAAAPIAATLNPDIVKRSIVVAGHKTSVSLEDAFWHALKDIARERGQSLRSLVAAIDAGREGGNLSSAVRLHVLDHYRRKSVDAAARIGGA